MASKTANSTKTRTPGVTLWLNKKSKTLDFRTVLQSGKEIPDRGISRTASKRGFELAGVAGAKIKHDAKSGIIVLVTPKLTMKLYPQTPPSGDVYYWGSFDQYEREATCSAEEFFA